MNKNKIYLLLALVALVITATAVWKISNRCNCLEYKTYTETTVYSDMTFESRQDSICVVGGKRNGDVMVRKFEE